MIQEGVGFHQGNITTRDIDIIGPMYSGLYRPYLEYWLALVHAVQKRHGQAGEDPEKGIRNEYFNVS